MKQVAMILSVRETLAEIAKDVRTGLLETVGVDCSFSIDKDRCSVALELPADTDSKKIAEAIDLENVEAWLGVDNKVRLGIDPWYSTKDVDQTVLAAVKVIHVMLGLHASDNDRPASALKDKFFRHVMEIMKLRTDMQKR